MGKLAEAARGWKNVKWRHRGRSRLGVDCAGLVWCAYRDCGIELPDYRLYGREPFRNGLVTHATAALGEPLSPRTPLQDDDVLLMRFEVEPHHMAIVVMVEYGDTHALNIIHSDGKNGRVLEQRLTPDMVSRITHIYRKGVL